MREAATWPEGREFETLQPMMRITLNAILRTVFGAQGSAFDELRQLLPPMVPLASRMAVMPTAFRARPRPVESVGSGAAVSQALQRDHRRAHLRSTGRPGVRGAQRRARPHAAGTLRRRLADLRRPHRRRTAHAARRRPRDDGDDTGLGDRAAPAASAPAVPADRGGRRGWIGASTGDDLGSSAHPSGGGGHRPGGTRPNQVG